MENVIKINQNSTYDHIQAFLNDLESENTKKSYKAAISDFFKWKYKKIPMEFINPTHLNSLTYPDMKGYRSSLRKKYSCNTVNNRMNALYSLLKDLVKIQERGQYVYTYRLNDLRLKPLKNTDAEEYGYVEWEEVTNWINYLLNSDQNNKEGKAAMFHIGRLTGIRKEGLCQAQFKDLIKEDGVWTLKSVLKGNKYKYSLNDDDAQMLLNLKKTDDPKEKIFKMSVKTIERTFAHILEVFNVPEERNVVPHSLRGLAIYEAYESSGRDILVAQKLAGHESIETTYNYIKKRRELHAQPTLYMGEEFNSSEVDSLTVEDWKAIYSKMNRSAKYEMLRILKQKI
ncbi:hypothetical protein GCM10008931_43010 [Oceanobacillus oncorhynchi subsp. oncorhynchi]|uniref:tyrosine-type recombinase/integrase n=1 Tax=Oceanobacillus oncorhynchi TaxID=545501 RepID=UPI0031DF5E23